MYKKFSDQPPLGGRVIRALPSGAALITTETHTAEAFPDELAPLLLPGAEVMLGPEAAPGVGSSAPTSAVIVRETSDSEWPPRYAVRLPNAGVVTVTHDAFIAIAPARGAPNRDGSQSAPRRSPLPQEPPGSLPSIAPTLPGAPFDVLIIHCQTTI